MSERVSARGEVDGGHHTPALFQILASQTNDNVHWLLDADGVIVAAAGACEALLGRSPHALLGVSLVELSAIDSAASTRDWIRTIGERGFDRRETRLHRPDGSFVDVEITAQRPHDSPDRFVCALHDIGERRAQETEMRSDSEGYRAVFDHALDAMVALDDHRRILDLNHAAVDMLGARDQELRGQSFDAHLDVTVRDVFTESWARVLEMGEERGNLRLAAHDGLSRRIEFAIRAHYKLGHHLLVMRDITARHELELQLRRAQKLEALGRLAGGVAHDFNNLLTAVLVSADVLLEDDSSTGERAKDLHVIRDAANRASTLTRQLLSFGRQQWSAPRTFDLHDVITESARLLQRLIGPGITIELAIGKGPYHVRADEGQLEQVLLNLALNARDAMPDGGTLHIAAESFDPATQTPPVGVTLHGMRCIRLIVRDNGIGMDADVQARLFEPFFTTKADRGTGLGLPTVYGIVQQCGGAIHVHSEIARGSTFTVFLPEATDPTPPAGIEAIPAPDTHRIGRVLVVDDDPDVRAVVVRVLERSGHAVTSANGADEALAQVNGATVPFDVLVSDLTMPGMRGDVLAIELLARMPTLGVVFITGDAAPDLHKRDARGRRATVLRKPFTTRELERLVQRALSQQITVP